MAQTTLPAYLERIAVRSLDAQLSAVHVHTYSCEDGRQRRLYSLGQEHPIRVVLLPPYGMTFLLVLRLAALLAQQFNVLIWESAACPDGACGTTDDDFTLSAQSRDFARILRQQGITDFHFVGWCQAAQLAVHAIIAERIRPSTMSWLGPSGFGHSLVKSEFERCALPIYLEIERRGSEEAGKLAKILDKYQGETNDDNLTGERLTMLHLVDPAATHIFSRYMKSFENNKAIVKEILPDALCAIPTQIVHCRDDTYSHYSESVQVSKNFPDITLHLLDAGGHLQVFDAPDLPAQIVQQFIESHALALSKVS